MPQMTCTKFGSDRSNGAKVEKRYGGHTDRHTNVYFNRICCILVHLGKNVANADRTANCFAPIRNEIGRPSACPGAWLHSQSCFTHLQADLEHSPSAPIRKVLRKR